MVVEAPDEVHMTPVWIAAAVLALMVIGATLTGLYAGTVASRSWRAPWHRWPMPAPRQAPGAEIAEVDAVRRLLVAAADEREAAIGSLRHSEATFRAMFDGLPDAVVLADIERDASNSSIRRSLRASATPPTRSSGAPPSSCMPIRRTSRGSDRRTLRRAPARRSAHEVHYRRKDGTEVWCESVGLRIIGADGAPLGLFGVHRDITERKRAEENLRRSQAQMTAFIEQAPHGIAMLDRDLKFLAVSRLWLNEYGNGRSALVGLHHATSIRICRRMSCPPTSRRWPARRSDATVNAGSGSAAASTGRAGPWCRGPINRGDRRHHHLDRRHHRALPLPARSRPPTTRCSRRARSASRSACRPMVASSMSTGHAGTAGLPP
jgi:two-component system, sensor histidine kinase and response regulator